MSKRAKVPQHPAGHKFMGGCAGYRLWHVGPMHYEITKCEGFEVVATVEQVGKFIRTAERLKAMQAFGEIA